MCILNVFLDEYCDCGSSGQKSFENKFTTTVGFKDAFSFRWWEVISNMKQCMAKCANCSAITTGDSQGGALELIRALYLKRYFDIDSFVFLFGSPPATNKKCQKYLSSHRWYHSIQAIPHEDGLQYDIVPALSGEISAATFLPWKRDSPFNRSHSLGWISLRWNGFYPNATEHTIPEKRIITWSNIKCCTQQENIQGEPHQVVPINEW